MRKVLPNNAGLIPDNAKRVFTGKIFDVYQWPQTMFDGRIETFEMIRRPDTVQILLIQDGEVLLVNDAQPGRGSRMHVPHGKAEGSDDSWLSAAKRELREETGLVCNDWRLVSVLQPFPRLEWFSVMYLAQDIAEKHSQELDPGGEKIEVLWKPFDEVRTLALSETDNSMSYMMPLFLRVETPEELLGLPVFPGNEVDR